MMNPSKGAMVAFVSAEKTDVGEIKLIEKRTMDGVGGERVSRAMKIHTVMGNPA